ncbi:MAG: hypothetical protein Q9206_000706 [Seirophora lacunosa]
MEQVKKFRNALILGAGRELDAFSHAMRQELANSESAVMTAGVYELAYLLTSVLDDETHQTEVRRLQEQISFLRQQASRANDLERELRHMKYHGPIRIAKDTEASTLATKSERPNATPSIAGDDGYDELHQRFLACSFELERVKEAMKLVQRQAKRWKEAYRSVHSGGQCGGPKPFGGPANGTPRRRSAPEVRPLLRAESAAVMASSVKKSIPHAREKGIRVGSSPQDDRNTQDISGDVTEKVNLSGARADFRAPSSQTQDDSNAEISGVPMYTLQPAPQPRNINESERDPLVGRQTKDTVDSDPDSPVFVRENNLKRRRGKPPVETSRSSKRVKEEPLSSSPAVIHASSVAKGPQESIDLDEIPNTLYTPRKYQGMRRRMSSIPQGQSFIEAHPGEDGDESHLLEKADTLLRDFSDGSLSFGGRPSPDRDLSDIQDEVWCHEAGELYTAQLLQDLKAQRKIKARVKRGHDSLQVWAKQTAMDNQDTDTQNCYQPGHNETTHRPALQPVEANKAPRRNNDSVRNPPRKPSPSGWHHGAQYIGSLSEDGENALDPKNLARGQHTQAPNPMTSTVIRNGLKRVNTSAEHRLDQLLAGPLPEKPHLSPDSIKAGIVTASGTRKLSNAILGQDRPRMTSRTPPIGQRIQSTVKKPKIAPQSATKAPITPDEPTTYTTPFSKSSTARPAMKPDPPLRSRPLSHLFLDDFKVNPAQNQGYSHPFKEVVRSRDQRNCLPGCTRLECCGTIFRKIAETGLIKTFHTSRLFASSQEDEDLRMMEDFLGDQAYRLRNMSEGEKAEVLLQSRTKVLADHYGRHREVYAREPSPIGYWDVDMPSTQQAEEQVKLAEARTRQKVEERYREAVRTDGLWKFRDE